MDNLFFLLSGEHQDLPLSELKAILEAEEYSYRISEKLDQVVRLKADINCVETLTRRASLTRLCALELFNSQAETDSIIKTANSINLTEILKESFAVRLKRVKDYAPNINTMALERTLGELILNKNVNAKVNLKKPEKTFTGILTENKLVFGVKLAEIPAKPFVERRPRNKPFFHPSAMQAKLARCMVNLAKPKAGYLMVDPFCGTGSMLTEASLIGCRVLGLDVQRRMAKGTLKNFGKSQHNLEGVIVADVRKLPLTRIDCVVTDPPYGISSTTKKRTTRQLVEELLTSTRELLDKGKRVCVASPKTLKIREIGTALGYKHLESHFVYVHRSLTREIAVFEKV